MTSDSAPKKKTPPRRRGAAGGIASIEKQARSPPDWSRDGRGRIVMTAPVYAVDLAAVPLFRRIAVGGRSAPLCCFPSGHMTPISHKYLTKPAFSEVSLPGEEGTAPALVTESPRVPALQRLLVGVRAKRASAIPHATVRSRPSPECAPLAAQLAKLGASRETARCPKLQRLAKKRLT